MIAKKVVVTFQQEGFLRHLILLFFSTKIMTMVAKKEARHEICCLDFSAAAPG